MEIVKKEGVTMRQLRCLARCNGADVQSSGADQSTLVELRAHVDEAIRAAHGPHLITADSRAAPGQTSCPGKDLMRYLDAGLLRRWVDECRSEEWPGVKELPAPAGKP